MSRAVVIGASRGFGAYVANQLAELGWEVAATGRRSRDLTELGENVRYTPSDLADASQLVELGTLLAKISPDLIVHNAVSYGPAHRSAPSLGELEELFRVNALLPYRLLLAYVRDAAPGTRSSCIIVNSDSVYGATKSSGVYAASKAALRVLTTELAHECHGSEMSVSTLMLGPLDDHRKREEFSRVARQRGLTEPEVVQTFLRRSNPSFVIDALIDFESCFRSLMLMAQLGKVANGMMCRLDGGSAGSLI